MHAVDVIRGGLKRSRSIWERAMRPDGGFHGPIPEMPRDQLVWRPAPGSHSVGRLLWHIAEVEDRWLREFIFQEEFKPRFGYGSLDKVDNDAIPSWDELMTYLQETRERTLEALPGLAERLTEERRFYQHPATVGFILMGMITHEAGHAGQIAHIMGMIRRSGW